MKKQNWFIGYLASNATASYAMMTLAPLYLILTHPDEPPHFTLLQILGYIFILSIPFALTVGLLIALIVSAPMFGLFYGAARYFKINNMVYFMIMGALTGNSQLMYHLLRYGPPPPHSGIEENIILSSVIGVMCGWIFWRIAIKPTMPVAAA